MTPPFFGSKIMNVLVFFDFEPKQCFRVATPWGLDGMPTSRPPKIGRVACFNR